MASPSRDDELVLLPLGGAGEIGMNFNAYGFGPPDNRKWIVVDCGVLFGRESATPGVDVIMPDISYLAEQRADVLGIVATHAHEDHIGAIHYLWPMLRCPVYATPFTARLIAGKLEEANLTGKVRLNAVPLHGKLRLGPFGIEFVSITHSIPEPNALAIRTPLGLVVHTGDWKIDPEPLVGETTDANALQKLGDEGVLATVCDSTNALVAGESGSEATVRDALSKLIGTLTGRVAVTAFASNIARLDSIARAACANGREIVLVGRAMHKLVAAARDSGYLADFPRVLDEEEAAQLPPRHVLYLCTGSQGEMRAALTRIAADENPNVKLGPGDTVIFSSRIIPGNELAIYALHNKLASIGVEILSADDHFVHVSGHPARDELAQMYRWTRPQIAVPVHGELRHMTAHARLARSLQVPQAVNVENGQMLRLAPGRAQVIDETPAGRIHLDGRVLVSEGVGLTRVRRSLSFAGMIAITLVLDGKGRVAADPAIVLEGIPEPVHEAVRTAVEGAVKRYDSRRDDEERLRETVRRTARAAADGAWGKKPVTRVEVVWV
ncbi:MAG: ribonuclease J [Alphaproteobacteria bacterium]|nr:ribonuclease J [Alphaproteobacteria bacterium]MDE2111739.1 ribonuclease J [Alphaproteobacteria bacterium]